MVPWKRGSACTGTLYTSESFGDFCGVSRDKGEMEFLGSFWRARLTDGILDDAELIADFSINAVRRLDLAEGRRSVFELPANRLLVFPRPPAPAA